MVYSMKLSELYDWVKNKAKPGDLAYHYDDTLEYLYVYYYTKPDNDPVWQLCADHEKLQEYFNNLEELKMNKRCENCIHWHYGNDIYSFCTHSEHNGVVVPAFANCPEYEEKEMCTGPFSNFKFYLKNNTTGELEVRYVCEACGKEMEEPHHWWFAMPVAVNSEPSKSTKSPGFHFRCKECDKKKDGKI